MSPLHSSSSAPPSSREPAPGTKVEPEQRLLAEVGLGHRNETSRPPPRGAVAGLTALEHGHGQAALGGAPGAGQADQASTDDYGVVAFASRRSHHVPPPALPGSGSTVGGAMFALSARSRPKLPLGVPLSRDGTCRVGAPGDLAGGLANRRAFPYLLAAGRRLVALEQHHRDGDHEAHDPDDHEDQADGLELDPGDRDGDPRSAGSLPPRSGRSTSLSPSPAPDLVTIRRRYPPLSGADATRSAGAIGAAPQPSPSAVLKAGTALTTL